MESVKWRFWLKRSVSVKSSAFLKFMSSWQKQDGCKSRPYFSRPKLVKANSIEQTKLCKAAALIGHFVSLSVTFTTLLLLMINILELDSFSSVTK